MPHDNGHFVEAVEADAAERRRFAPSPPCMPVGCPDAPPGVPLSQLSIPPAEPFATLDRIAGAIDVLHGFRLAHGDLRPENVFLDGKTVWFAELGARWELPSSTKVSPREIDLLWFKELCQQWLGLSKDAPTGRTARRILQSFARISEGNLSGSSSLAESADEIHNEVDSDSRVLAKPTIRQKKSPRLPWIILLTVIALVGGTAFVVFALSRHGQAAHRFIEPLRNLFFEKESASTRYATKPQYDRESPLARKLFMLNRLALLDALTSDEPGMTDELDDVINQNDATFHSVLAMILDTNPEYCERAAPRLLELLRRPHSNSGQFAIERAFLKAARPQDISIVRELLGSPRQDTVLEACWTLIRLGDPPRFPEVKKLAKNARGITKIGFAELALSYYPYDEIRSFVVEQFFDETGRPKTDFFSFAASIPDTRGLDGKLRPSAQNTERLLLDLLPKVITSEGERADADLIMTLTCLWRLKPASPKAMLRQLELSETELTKLQRRLSSILILEDRTQSLGVDWQPPDAWYASVMRWTDSYPRAYLSYVLQRDNFGLGASGAIVRQSRLMALAELQGKEARDELFAELDAKLDVYHNSWRLSQPESLFGVIGVMAALENESVAQSLKAFFQGRIEERAIAAWDGFLTGAVCCPHLHIELLQKAATHPYPSIWRRARTLLSLAQGDVASFRAEPNPPPSLSPVLISLRDELNRCKGELETQILLSRQRDGLLQELALGVCSSEGARLVLTTRVDRRQSFYATHSALANQPRPLDNRFDDFVHRDPPYHLVEQPMMLALEVRNDTSSLSTLTWFITTAHAGRHTPPLVHRATAAYVVSSLLRGKADRTIIQGLLEASETDASSIVRRAAAGAALRCVTKVDKQLLLDFVREHRDLDPEVVKILSLASKIE